MTAANKVTLFRILLVPFFIVQVLYFDRSNDPLYRLLAIFAFALAALTDGIDGYIARRYNQRSELGALLDPLADKLLLVSGIILLSLDHAPVLERIPIWFTATIISRDLLLLMGWAVIHTHCGRVRVRPRMLGKIATVLQMATVLWILLQWDSRILDFLIYGATATTGGSGFLYIMDGIRLLSASPSSGPER